MKAVNTAGYQETFTHHHLMGDCDMCSQPYPFVCGACQQAIQTAMQADAEATGMVEDYAKVDQLPQPTGSFKPRDVEQSLTQQEKFERLFIGSGEDLPCFGGC